MDNFSKEKIVYIAGTNETRLCYKMEDLYKVEEENRKLTEKLKIHGVRQLDEYVKLKSIVQKVRERNQKEVGDCDCEYGGCRHSYAEELNEFLGDKE